MFVNPPLSICADGRQHMSNTHFMSNIKTRNVGPNRNAKVELRPRHEPEGLERYAEYFFFGDSSSIRHGQWLWCINMKVIGGVEINI